MAEDNYNRGIYFMIISWTLNALVLVAVSIRVYSRTFLTRSFGSDDFTIIIALILTLVGEVTNVLSFTHGLGHHFKYVSHEDFSQVEKWEYVGWIIVFLSYFFIRTSVMLFVLRLLPPHKKKSSQIICVAFFFNIAITILATVMYGIKCVPFSANYKDVPGAKCLPQSVTTASQYVNGILACIIDITTALIPEFLLWKVQLKPKTKRILYTLFGLGLITAGLSIGRVATSNNGVWEKDTTWRLIPSDMFSLVERKCGIIFASCPAVRQFFAYRQRMGTFRPAPGRQPPMADFIKFRRRVNLRDIFWYRKAIPVNGRVLEARRIFEVADVDLHHVNTEQSPEPAPTEKSQLDVAEAATKHKTRRFRLPFRNLRSKESSASSLRQGLTVQP